MKRELRSKSAGTKVSEAELRVLESRAERAILQAQNAAQRWDARMNSRSLYPPR